MNSTDITVDHLPPNMQCKVRVVPSGCWEWTGAKNSSGYGCVAVQQTSKLTHRVAYELFVGPIPDGLQVDHLCRSITCCNPTHLETVTQKENASRRPDAHKSHCVHGHPMTPENTLVKTRNGRVMKNCRECERQAQRRRRAAKTQVQTSHHEETV